MLAIPKLEEIGSKSSRKVILELKYRKALFETRLFLFLEIIDKKMSRTLGGSSGQKIKCIKRKHYRDRVLLAMN